MTDFLSGIQQKVNDTTQSITNKFSDTANGNVPTDATAQDAPPAEHQQDMVGGARGGFSAANGMRKQYNEDQAAGNQPQEPGKKGMLKKIGRFFKSAFGYGNAARKGENAVEDLTGREINFLPQQQQQQQI
jgi:hypothetical protein